VVAALIAVATRMEDSMKLTDTQLRLLAAASHRDDRALERPSNLTGGAAGKVVAKLLAEGLVEEIQSRGSLPVRGRFASIGTRSWNTRHRGHPTPSVRDSLLPRRGPCGDAKLRLVNTLFWLCCGFLKDVLHAHAQCRFGHVG
jgi:hypothetical protein